MNKTSPPIDMLNQTGSSSVSPPEKELRTLRLAVEQSRDGINIVDLHGAIIYANPASEAMYGYRKGQLVGRHISVLNIDPRVSQTQILPAVLSTGSWSGELIQKKQNGSQFPVYLSASIVLKNNKPIGMLGIVRDITESKMIEQALRKSEARYRMLHESLRDAYVQVGLDGRIIDFNDLYCKMLGYSSLELSALTYQELTPERWHAVDAAIVRDQIIPLGYSDVYEKEYRRKDGTTFPVELRTILSRDAEGQPLGMWATVRDITERKRAEQKLKHERDLLQSIMNGASHSHLVYLDCNFNFILVNETYARACGYAPEEMVGKNHFALYPHAENEAIFKRVRDTGEPFQVQDKPFVFADQPERGVTYWDWTLTPVKNGAGQVKGLIFSLHDTTAHVRAELALRESEQKYRSLFENIQELVSVYEVERDASGRIVERRLREANRAFLRAVGVPSANEIRGKTSSEIFGKVWSEAHLSAVQKAMDTGKVQEIEIFHPETGRHYDSSIIRLDADTYMGTARDITERKKAEAALRESEDRFRTLANNMSQFAWIADANGWIYWYNRRWYDFTGTNLEQMQGWGWTKVHHPDHVDRVVEKISHYFRTGEVWEETFLLRGQDGQYRWFLTRAVPIRDESGRILHWFGTNTDITVQREAEQALREFAATLEQQVAQRTALLEARSKQLQTLAVALIEAEEREKRQFACLLHDDLQQILAAAKMQLEALAETLPAAPMLSNVVDLLNESIAKTRRLSHQLSPAILHQAGLIATLGWLAGQMKAQFGLQVDLDLNTELLMERTPQKVFLFRAVQELLFNTVKHAGLKRARVEVTSSEDSITVTVSDQGCGFDPATLHGRTSNIGFGLLTIKERASYVGGTFSIESTPGRGSHFTLKVPNAAANTHEETFAQASFAEEESRKPARSKGTKSDAGRTRVLFVDDHKVMRQGLIKLVKDQPFIDISGEASNGREALEQAKALKPDVIIMDISMPEMDGIEATRRIKAESPQVRVIGLSMHDDPQLTASMQQAGAEATLSKTTSAAELVKAIYGSPISCD